MRVDLFFLKISLFFICTSTSSSFASDENPCEPGICSFNVEKQEATNFSSGINYTITLYPMGPHTDHTNNISGMLKAAANGEGRAVLTETINAMGNNFKNNLAANAIEASHFGTACINLNENLQRLATTYALAVGLLKEAKKISQTNQVQAETDSSSKTKKQQPSAISVAINQKGILSIGFNSALRKNVDSYLNNYRLVNEKHFIWKESQILFSGVTQRGLLVQQSSDDLRNAPAVNRPYEACAEHQAAEGILRLNNNPQILMTSTIEVYYQQENYMNTVDHFPRCPNCLRFTRMGKVLSDVTKVKNLTAFEMQELNTFLSTVANSAEACFTEKSNKVIASKEEL